MKENYVQLYKNKDLEKNKKGASLLIQINIKACNT